ncbi:MAG: hypothetical protein ABEH83_01005 [Halobacterium sp.]
MHWLRAAGLAATGLGLAGYAAGVATPYPGRAFSVTAVIVGITLLSITTGVEVES